MNDLYTKVTYTQDIPILSGDIYEYDISKANISILYDRKLIDYNKYQYLYDTDSQVRKVIIGNMQRDDPNLTKELQQGIIEYKKKLFESNGLRDEEVLSIKNDAVFTIRPLDVTSFGNIVFKLKNHYNLFIKVYKLEFYYNDSGQLDIKGIQDSVLDLQKEHLVAFLKELFTVYRTQGVVDSLNLLSQFYILYNNKQLDPELYRDFRTGRFILYTDSMYSYESDIFELALLPYIGVYDNNAIFRELARILYVEYLR